MLVETILHHGTLLRRTGGALAMCRSTAATATLLTHHALPAAPAASLARAACAGGWGAPSQLTAASGPSAPQQHQQQQCLHVCSALPRQPQQSPWQGQQQWAPAWWQTGGIPQQQQQQQQQTACMATLAPYAAAPQPLPRFHKPDRSGRMQRMVIRVPPEVQVTLQDQHLLLSGGHGTAAHAPAAAVTPHL
jgi:hypothetical protein